MEKRLARISTAGIDPEVALLEHTITYTEAICVCSAQAGRPLAIEDIICIMKHLRGVLVTYVPECAIEYDNDIAEM